MILFRFVLDMFLWLGSHLRFSRLLEQMLQTMEQLSDVLSILTLLPR